MISIIVPIYNVENYLLECLESIRNQSYSNFEVLCINDGSTDNSKSICENIIKIDNRFRLINQTNKGVSASRNLGINLSKGEYICFIDSDDVVDRNYLLNLIKNIDGYDSVYHEFTRESNRLGFGTNKKYIYEPADLINKVLNAKIKHPSIVSFLFRTKIIRDNSIFYVENCYINEDTEFYIKYLSCCKTPIVRLEYNAYFYRTVSTSAMHNFSMKSLTSIEATARMKSILEAKNIITYNNIMLETAVLTYVYYASRNNNIEIYNYLHQKYNVSSYAYKLLKHSNVKYVLLAISYLLLRKTIFYKLLSK